MRAEGMPSPPVTAKRRTETVGLSRGKLLAAAAISERPRVTLPDDDRKGKGEGAGVDASVRRRTGRLTSHVRFQAQELQRRVSLSLHRGQFTRRASEISGKKMKEAIMAKSAEEKKRQKRRSSNHEAVDKTVKESDSESSDESSSDDESFQSKDLQAKASARLQFRGSKAFRRFQNRLSTRVAMTDFDVEAIEKGPTVNDSNYHWYRWTLGSCGISQADIQISQWHALKAETDLVIEYANDMKKALALRNADEIQRSAMSLQSLRKSNMRLQRVIKKRNLQVEACAYVLSERERKAIQNNKPLHGRSTSSGNSMDGMQTVEARRTALALEMFERFRSRREAVKSSFTESTHSLNKFKSLMKVALKNVGTKQNIALHQSFHAEDLHAGRRSASESISMLHKKITLSNVDLSNDIILQDGEATMVNIGYPVVKGESAYAVVSATSGPRRYKRHAKSKAEKVVTKVLESLRHSHASGARALVLLARTVDIVHPSWKSIQGIIARRPHRAGAVLQTQMDLLGYDCGGHSLARPADSVVRRSSVQFSSSCGSPRNTMANFYWRCMSRGKGWCRKYAASLVRRYKKCSRRTV